MDPVLGRDGRQHGGRAAGCLESQESRSTTCAVVAIIGSVLDGPIYHLALAEDWEHSPSTSYTTSTLGRTLAEQGFIHCSFRHQVQQIADLVYRGRPDVVLLEIDPARLGAAVQVEGAHGAEEFPHIYGPLNREAVVKVTPLDIRVDGCLDVANAL